MIIIFLLRLWIHDQRCNHVEDLVIECGPNLEVNKQEVPVSAEIENEDCLKASDPTGADYSGSLSVSESGSTCLKWNDPSLSFQLWETQKYIQHNYCRNPGGEDEAPFCFTSKVFHL